MRSGDRSLADKEDRLLSDLKKMNAVAVAFSGGVDSTLLLAMVHRALGPQTLAITAASATHPAGELELAISLARQLDVRHLIIETDELEDPGFTRNDPERCYFCKRRLFKAMISRAILEGFQVLVHGVNADDLLDYRPGIKAADEFGVVSPLAQAGLSKTDVRQLARKLRLPNWNRPAMACLASRIPYGTVIQERLLAKIDRAEQVVRQLGAKVCRVRHHGHLARIEAGADDIEVLTRAEVRHRLVMALKGLGYKYVSLDLEGYESGKMNRDLTDQSTPR